MTLAALTAVPLPVTVLRATTNLTTASLGATATLPTAQGLILAQPGMVSCCPSGAVSMLVSSPVSWMDWIYAIDSLSPGHTLQLACPGWTLDPLCRLTPSPFWQEHQDGPWPWFVTSYVEVCRCTLLQPPDLLAVIRPCGTAPVGEGMTCTGVSLGS